MYAVTHNVYLDADGKASFERGKGSELILVRGAVVSDEQARELGLPELAKQRNSQAVERALEQHRLTPKKKTAEAKAPAAKTGGK